MLTSVAKNSKRITILLSAIVILSVYMTCWLLLKKKKKKKLLYNNNFRVYLKSALFQKVLEEPIHECIFYIHNLSTQNF